MDGMQSVLAPYQLDLVALLCPSTDDADEYIKRIVSRGIVDGLVISHTRQVDPRIPFLKSREVPFVALGRSQTDVGHPWIDIDFEDIARKSMHRFVARGHRRIAIALPREVNFSRIFRESAERALAEHGLKLDPDLVFRSSAGDPGGYAIARRILELRQPPTAIAVANEAMTSGLYRGLLEAGRVPGRDIAVIGRDSPNTRYLSPRLTCFHLNLQDLGAAIGEILLSAMPPTRNDFPNAVTRRVFPTRFMQGESDNYALPL
jgi:DNA-binding LacI/PurR family transcriptional regulator